MILLHLQVYCNKLTQEIKNQEMKATKTLQVCYVCYVKVAVLKMSSFRKLLLYGIGLQISLAQLTLLYVPLEKIKGSGDSSI